MQKFEKCHVTRTVRSWTLLLSQTVTSSRTPSPLERDEYEFFGRPYGYEEYKFRCKMAKKRSSEILIDK